MMQGRRSTGALQAVLWAFLVTLVVVVVVSASPAPPGPGNRIPVDGANKYLLGVNYPWGFYNGNSNYGRDFGQNAWGYTGFAASGNSGVNAAKFQQLRSSGARFVRVWVFADGRTGVDLDSQGYPGKVNDLVYADMDALIALASQHGLKLVLVLFDFHLGFKQQWNNNVQLGGRNSWINYPPHVTAITNNVIRPFVQRYGNQPVIHSWEVMNEPEWIIWDLPQGSYKSWEADGCSMQEFHIFASGICKAVHELTNHYCTLGSASLKWARIWVDAFAQRKGYQQIHLDYYQAHYYSWMDGTTINNDPDLGTVNISPLDQDYNALGLDRPMVIGEFYSTRMSFNDQLNTFYNKGYAGAWPWSVNSDYAIDYGTMTNWFHAHGDVSAPAQPPPTGNKNSVSQHPADDDESNPPATGNKNSVSQHPADDDESNPPATGNKNSVSQHPADDDESNPPATGNKNSVSQQEVDENDVSPPKPLGSNTVDNNYNNDGLSNGAIAGIVLSVVAVGCMASVVVGAVVAAVVVIVIRRRNRVSQVGTPGYYAQMIDDADTNPL